LKSFAQYLRSLKKRNELFNSFDLDSFEFDVAQGLIFQSNIPQGFGLGSSGALCAAVFDRYGGAKENLEISADISLNRETMALRKSQFALLETHFHGASSGIDPLISYLNRPLLIKNKNEFNQVKLPASCNKNGGLFLLNTGRPRRTEPLVNLFLEKRKTPEFEKFCQQNLIPVTDACISNFLEGNEEKHFDSFCQLSKLQFDHFSPMIPKLYQQTWQVGLATGEFALKLCGAGGGGYILGMTKDFDLTRSRLGGQEIRPILMNGPN
jgi:mevalonate kinase